MELIKIGENDYINADRVVGIQTRARAQHPDRKRGILGYVDDAVSITLAGSAEPAILFDEHAEALRRHLETTGKPTVDLVTKAEPVKATK